MARWQLPDARSPRLRWTGGSSRFLARSAWLCHRRANRVFDAQ
jgi:hypothetical protein